MKKKTNATIVADERVNVTNNVTSVNNSNSSDMVEENEKEVVYATKTAIIEGKEREIVLAYTEYDMEQPKDGKKLIEKMDTSKLFKCFYHLTKPDIFWNEGVKLVDENGNTIEEGTENVYVSCPTSESFWRTGLEEKLEYVEIHSFESVQEYAQAVGCTNLYSRGLSNIEKIGIAALATGDEACKTVYEFAKENKLNVTTAKLYLDYKVKPADIQSMTMGIWEEARPELGRKKEEAQELLDKVKEKFGKNAQKRYVIRVVNSLLRTNDDY